MEDTLKTGKAIKAMLDDLDVDGQLAQLKADIKNVKSISKKDEMVKQMKYLAGLKNVGGTASGNFTINLMPVIPPAARPATHMPGNRVKFADVNYLYKDHMLVNAKLKALVDSDDLEDSELTNLRANGYDGVRAIFGVGDALAGSSRAKNLKGLLKQIGGTTGPKTGFFQSKLLSKKQDFSGRATIYAEPNLGFNEMAVPKEMIWTMYEYHLIRDLVKKGYTFPEARLAVEERTPAAKVSFAKVIKEVPIIANRAPTLMLSNVTAHYPVPIDGKTLGINPLHLPLYAGDFDGDAMTVHVPMTPEAVMEARTKLLPEHHAYDFRRGLNKSMVAPGHEAILGSVYLTEPDKAKETHEFETEEDAIKAHEQGLIDINTPIRIRGVQ